MHHEVQYQQTRKAITKTKTSKLKTRVEKKKDKLFVMILDRVVIIVIFNSLERYPIYLTQFDSAFFL